MGFAGIDATLKAMPLRLSSHAQRKGQLVSLLQAPVEDRTPPPSPTTTTTHTSVSLLEISLGLKTNLKGHSLVSEAFLLNLVSDSLSGIFFFLWRPVETQPTLQ